MPHPENQSNLFVTLFDVLNSDLNADADAAVIVVVDGIKCDNNLF